MDETRAGAPIFNSLDEAKRGPKKQIESKSLQCSTFHQDNQTNIGTKLQDLGYELLLLFYHLSI